MVVVELMQKNHFEQAKQKVKRRDLIRKHSSEDWPTCNGAK